MGKKEKDVSTIDEQIRKIKKAAEELGALSEGFPAVACNTQRILASIKMLEIEVSDIMKVL